MTKLMGVDIIQLYSSTLMGTCCSNKIFFLNLHNVSSVLCCGVTSLYIKEICSMLFFQCNAMCYLCRGLTLLLDPLPPSIHFDEISL